MPPPVWNFAPQGQSGNYEAGFDRRSPYEKYYEQLQPTDYVQWSPPPAIPHGGVVAVSEVGGAMLRRPGSMNGMDDFFTYPEQQGVTPMQFIDQSVASGASPAPPPPGTVLPDYMEESALYGTGGARPQAGQMSWESQPAPWDTPHVPGWSGPAAAPPLAPGEVEPRVAQMQSRQIVAQRKKVIEAAQAAKIAADNAVRAAVAGAPKIAATNAATAQAAANVAASIAFTPDAQRAAAVAQSEATKAVAAANVAANNAINGGPKAQGMNDWMELSGFMDNPVVGGVRVKHLFYGAGVLAVGFFGWRYYKSGRG